MRKLRLFGHPSFGDREGIDGISARTRLTQVDGFALVLGKPDTPDARSTTPESMSPVPTLPDKRQCLGLAPFRLADLVGRSGCGVPTTRPILNHQLKLHE